MNLPLYCQARENPLTERPDSAHAGLWFDRFFNRFCDDWAITKPNDNNDPRKDWIKTVTGRIGDEGDLEAAALRRIELVDTLGGESKCFETDWNFVTGLGLPHPIENGFSWHPTFGVPYLPSAAVKGLVRAYVEGGWDEALSEEQINVRCNRWFGAEAGNRNQILEQAGDVIFFDALPVSGPTLVADIMTPHMGDWYESGDANPAEPKVTPGDWHDPNPIPFLVVKNATFLFSIASRRNGEVQSDELLEIIKALECALDWLGAGAKTAVGYGRMREDGGALQRLREKEKKIEEDREKENELAQMTPLERQIYDLEQKYPQDPDVHLLKLLEAGEWEGEDAVTVANRIKVLMEKSKKWKPNYSGRNKQHLKKHERTLKVLCFLGDYLRP